MVTSNTVVSPCTRPKSVNIALSSIVIQSNENCTAATHYISLYVYYVMPSRRSRESRVFKILYLNYIRFYQFAFFSVSCYFGLASNQHLLNYQLFLSILFVSGRGPSRFDSVKISTRVFISVRLDFDVQRLSALWSTGIRYRSNRNR
jgi:hypothetical protein